MADATACNGKEYYYATLTSSGSNYKNWFHVSSCTSCLAGYYEIKKSYDQFQTNCGKTCVFNYIDCERCDAIGNYYDSSSKSCKSCTNAPTNGYYTSNGGTSATGCSWGCNAGYYKNGSNCTICSSGYYCPGGDSGQKNCPSAPGTPTTTASPTKSAAGAKSITDCYVSKDATFKSDTNHPGTWKFSTDCPYSN
ncbi:MAG: hypothetical protein MJ187_04795 [Alphaproteobacteria bacterium]|nr:hypothetical protein [Alphaproteobacteria bacterium]